MYHLGKVLEVFRPTDRGVTSADTSVQACLRMWDENVLTMLVAPKIAGRIKAGQTVLVDYRPSPGHTPPIPSHTVVKIVEGKAAENTWKAYRKFTRSSAGRKSSSRRKAT